MDGAPSGGRAEVPVILLDGLLVIDCSTSQAHRRAGGVLADLHADVVIVEPVTGDEDRTASPVEYAVFNRGKRTVAFGPGDTESLLALIRSADVVLIDEPGRLACGLPSLPELRVAAPRTVIATVSAGAGLEPFDRLPAHESLVQAGLGMMAEQLGHRSGPIYCAIPFATIGAAHLTAIGVLAALYRRSFDGIGRTVETSLADGVLAYMSMYWSDTDARPAGRASNAVRSTGAPVTSRIVTGVFECADGEFLGISTPAAGAFGRFIAATGLDDRIGPSAHDRELMIELTDEERRIIVTEVPDLIASEPREIWVDRLLDADVCAIPQLRAGEIFDDRQAIDNGMVTMVDDSVLGPLEQIDMPMQFDGAPRRRRAAAPPAPSASVADELRRQRDREPFLTGSGERHTGPVLDGIRIVDVGAYIAGPYSSRLLASLGADVIKIEPPKGDPLRGIPRMFRAGQANKRSLSIDLRSPVGRDVLSRLIGWADIVHHNMRSRVAADLGLTIEAIQAVNPAAIVGIAPGWAVAGPNADRQSLEPMMSGYVGAAFEVAGRYNPPVYPICNSDMGNGIIGAIGLLVGLLERQRSGRAMSVVNPHLNAAMVHLAHVVRTTEGAVVGADRLDPMQLGVSTFDRLYQTEDGWIAIAARRRAEVEALAAGVAELSGDESLGDEIRGARLLSDDERLGDRIAMVTISLPTARCLDVLVAAGVPCIVPSGVVMGDFLNDPVHRASGRVVELESSTEGQVRELGRFLSISDSSETPVRIAPTLGQHSRSILHELAVPDDEVDRLIADGTVVDGSALVAAGGAA